MHDKTDVLDQRSADDFLNIELARDAILLFANSVLHYDFDDRYEQHFYRRKLRPHVLKYLDFSTPASVDQLLSYAVLSANRVLGAMYETDFLLLPSGPAMEFDEKEFDEFYAPGRRAAAACAMPYLEKYLFSFLGQEIAVGGSWTLPRVEEYFGHILSQDAASESLATRAIAASKDPKNAGQDWLLQLAPDFLLESSPMARYASGSFGDLGTSLFKVIIDELGYGEFDTKHSTLFENTLRSADLNHVPHHYWQYYLNSSLLLSNYFNMITRDKRHFFRYVGAIYYAETAFITGCRQWADTLKNSIPGLDVRYFNEHCHIDVDHSRMVMSNLVRPAIERYGDRAANDIVRGFEESRWLGEWAEKDFQTQIAWKDKAAHYHEAHDRIFDAVAAKAAAGEVKAETFVEPAGELSITHCHDEDELCHINSGVMEFINGFGKSTRLEAGKGIVIEHNRLHGALIESDECNYTIYTIRDVKQWV